MAWLFAMPPTLVTEKLITKPPLIYHPRAGRGGAVTKYLRNYFTFSLRLFNNIMHANLEKTDQAGNCCLE